MKRFAWSISLSIAAVLILAALPCSAADVSEAVQPKVRDTAATISVKTNAPPPASVLNCPPLPKWVLDGKLIAKPLDQKMLYTTFPPKVDYSQYITLTRCQDGAGGCFLYAALYVIDILKEKEHPYTPDLSYRYAQYYYNNRQVPQKKIHTDYGSCSEASLHSDYDQLVWVTDHFDDSKCPIPTTQNDAEAKRYRISDTSDPITPTVSTLKSLLVSKGPIWAAGTIGGVGHCIAIVGYDDAQNAFRFINSWGDTWNGDGYGLIPYNQVSQMLSYVTYFTNKPTERAGTPDAYTARIRVHHQNLRSELTVCVGVERLKPTIIWDRPNETGPPQDWNKNLDIDVPLPSYAASYWPPSPNNRWYVQITDGNKNGQSAVVEEVTLARLIKNSSGKYMTEVRRPHTRTFNVPDGGTLKIYVGAQSPTTELTLMSSQGTINSEESVTLSGLLSVKSYDTDPPAIIPLAGKEIKINAIVSGSDSIEQTQWRSIGSAMTDANGKFSLKVSPNATTTYIAAYTKPNGQIIAKSDQCRVQVGQKNITPIRKPNTPIIRPN